MISESPRERSLPAYVLAILGSFLIVAALVWAMRRYNQPAPLGEDRALVRARALAELRAADSEALNSVAWIDQKNGIVRLRVEDAMNIVERTWQNPPAARSNLLERVARANPPPPKPAPSPFE
jgi:hypothetical protein